MDAGAFSFSWSPRPVVLLPLSSVQCHALHLSVDPTAVGVEFVRPFPHEKNKSVMFLKTAVVFHPQQSSHQWSRPPLMCLWCTCTGSNISHIMVAPCSVLFLQESLAKQVLLSIRKSQISDWGLGLSWPLSCAVSLLLLSSAELSLVKECCSSDVCQLRQCPAPSLRWWEKLWR